MFRVKTFLITGILLFLLNGCGGISYIGYDQSQLLLQLDQNQLRLHGRVIGEKRDNFSTLFLSRKLIRMDDGTLIVYENAHTDLSYEFEPMITRIVKIIFEAKSVATIYTRNNLFAYQVLLKNNKILNVLAQQSDTQGLRLIYGMPTSKFNKMLRQLDPGAPGAYYQQGIQLLDTNQALLTKWDVRKVHLVPLVVPIGRFMGPF
jgi:hypothetical protein